MKASFLKRALGLPRTARNRRIIAMAGCDGLIEDLVPRFKLSETPALELFRRNQAAKAASLSDEFLNSPAMVSDAWKGPCNGSRHLITRYSLHGFHHKLCARRGFHDPDDRCVCIYCGALCSVYHFDSCPSAGSLAELAQRCGS